MQGSGRSRRRNSWKTGVVLAAGGLGMVGLSIWGLRGVAGLPGGKIENFPEDFYTSPLDHRVGKKLRALVEIGDDYPAKNGKVLSVVIDPKGHKIKGGIKIPKALVPGDLQKGQLYRCELSVNPDGFLIVEKIEKD